MIFLHSYQHFRDYVFARTVFALREYVRRGVLSFEAIVGIVMFLKFASGSRATSDPPSNAEAIVEFVSGKF